MKNKKTLIISASVIVAGVVGYFIYKKLRKKSNDSPTGETNDNQPTNTTYEMYTVTTNSGNLNVRQTASTSSAVVDSLPKGSSVYAKASTDGWMDVSKDGTTSIGFSSSKYLTKQ